MKKKKLSLILGSVAAFIGVGSIVATSAITLVSCGSYKSSLNLQWDKSIAKQLNDKYNEELKNAFGDQAFYQITAQNQPKIESVINKYINEVDYAINNVNKIENFSLQPGENFDSSLNLMIWLSSLKFELQTKLKLVQSNIRYIIVNSNDQMIMTNYSKSFQRTIASNASSNWKNSSGEYVSVSSKITQLNNVKQYITDVRNNLEEGLKNGVTWSGVMTKHTIGSMLQIIYNDFLQQFVSSSASGASVPTIKGTIYTNNTNYNDWKTNSNFSAEDKKLVEDAVNSVQDSIDSLMNFLIKDYYSKIKYGVTDAVQGQPNSYMLEVVDTNPNEEDNGFTYNSKYIKGLGLSIEDLNTKDIGIGFSGSQGRRIYEAMLQKHSNVINPKTQDQIKLGKEQVQEIFNAMEQVAHKLANIKTGNSVNSQEWKETFWWDADSSGNQYASEEQKDVIIRNSSGQVDMSLFFKWLNSDQWFDGRDMRQDQFPTIDGTNELVVQNSTNPTNTNGKKPYKYKEYKLNSSSTDLVASVIGGKDSQDNTTTTLGDAGNLYYQYIVKNLSPATIQTSSTITSNMTPNAIKPAAAYIGSSHAVFQYLTYKANVNNHIGSMFKDTKADWTLRTGTGGAAYASSGSGTASWIDNGGGGFYLDVNPYFGLQKWSMSTLTNHEAMSGHVFQFAYADQHPASQDAVRFRSTAYSEGWGLFSEWLAAQVGIYGTPTPASGKTENGKFVKSNMLALPTFGNGASKSIEKIEDYANDVYKVNNETNKEYYDALQYFGFLNERQLRAMRITVDLGIHSGSEGTYAKGTGYSLNEARDYLKANSGLGLDDINRETKRYLEYTAQATSYYNGLVEMENYFLKAKEKFELNTSNKTAKFLDWTDPSKTKGNTEELFDLILRNGSIPMPVLTWAVDKYLENKYKPVAFEELINQDVNLKAIAKL